MRTGKREV